MRERAEFKSILKTWVDIRKRVEINFQSHRLPVIVFLVNNFLLNQYLSHLHSNNHSLGRGTYSSTLKGKDICGGRSFQSRITFATENIIYVAIGAL